MVSLQMAFQQGGTWGAGKLFHHRVGFVDLRGWNEFFARSRATTDSTLVRKVSGGGANLPQNRKVNATVGMIDLYPTHSYIKPTPEQMAVYDGLTVDYSDFSPHQQEFLKFVARHGDIDKAMQAYCADVTAMDRALGRLFDFLESEGLNENTMVVFSSDNGPGPLATQVNNGSVVERYVERPDLLNNVGSAKIYKERKVSLHDGGIRVPFIVSWPEKIPGGKVDHVSVIHGTDWLPTITSLCGIELPEGTYDGTDVSSALLGEETVREKDIYWTQAGTIALMRDRWKAMLKSDGEFLLYDIESDPEELHDLKAGQPKLAEELKKSIIDWSAEIQEDI